MTEILHRRWGGTLCFDEEAVTLARPLRRTARLPWEEVEAVRPTPWHERFGSEWRPRYRAGPFAPTAKTREWFEERGHLLLELIVPGPRRPSGFASRAEPQLEAPARCVVALELRKREIKPSANALFDLLDGHGLLRRD